MKFIFAVVIFFLGYCTQAQIKPFRFAFISDTHIGSPNGGAEEDLRRTIRDINATPGLAFVVLTGDITELGGNDQLLLAKQILDSLQIPYYIIPGNHDTGWSESGGVMFNSVFGNDKFQFDYNGIRFLGCASGPYVRMSDGHVPRDAVNWLDNILAKTSKDQPVIFLNHYPIDNSLDNWYEITTRLREQNTLAILCGHGHANKALDFEGIPGVMGRSNLRAKAPVGGYNIVTVTDSLLSFTEKKPGTDFSSTWTSVPVVHHDYHNGEAFTRPNYDINKTYPGVKERWSFSSDANIISTPATTSKFLIAGNQLGKISAYKMKNGKPAWSFITGGAIFSSPAVSGSSVVVGSGDKYIYCLDANSGKLNWKFETGAAVLGSPLIHGDTVFIGASDHAYRAISLSTGKEIWKFGGLNGPVVSTPLLYDGKLIFGAWDTKLYAVKSNSGKLVWEWSNGSPVINYSPASCIPVAANGVVYVVAPDRYLTALDAATGKVLWRNNDAGLRESIGISADGQWIYGKSMQDTIAIYKASAQKQFATEKIDAGFGYEHVPSMLIEKKGMVYFGTKNGVVYALDAGTKTIAWAHKIDNSMVNTVNVLSDHSLAASTMDGRIVVLDF